jgi:hypothetical protein
MVYGGIGPDAGLVVAIVDVQTNPPNQSSLYYGMCVCKERQALNLNIILHEVNLPYEY